MIAVYEERVDINFGRLFFVLIKNIVVACFHFFRLFLWQIFFSIITLICNKCFQTAKFFFQSCIKYFMYLFFFAWSARKTLINQGITDFSTKEGSH